MIDIHPIIVHFPIALLTLYAFIELVSLHPKLKNNRTVFYIKLVLLIAGTLGSIAAVLSWWVAQKLLGNSSLVRTHKSFGEMTRNIFVVLSLIYLAKLYVYERKTPLAKALPPFLQNILLRVEKYARKTFAPQILALVWLFFVTVTWALWWAIIYGKTADPIIKRAVNTFVK